MVKLKLGDNVAIELMIAHLQQRAPDVVVDVSNAMRNAHASTAHALDAARNCGKASREQQCVIVDRAAEVVRKETTLLESKAVEYNSSDVDISAEQAKAASDALRHAARVLELEARAVIGPLVAQTRLRQ